MFRIKTSLVVTSPKEVSQRIDQYLVAHGIPLSRSVIQNLIRKGGILVDGKSVKPSYRLHGCDRIEVTFPETPSQEPVGEKIPIDILYEDEDLLVVNKPAGLVVHPAPGHPQGTLVNALLHHDRALRNLGSRERPGIVHRLDKETSGVMVVAKKAQAYADLIKQFQSHTIKRKYLALVMGRPSRMQGEIYLPIGRDQANRKKFSSRTRRPKSAITRYQILECFPEVTLMDIIPETGRTHQIRVHFSFLRHPIVGDSLYGKPTGRSIRGFAVKRQMLHAWVLGFVHPIRKEFMEYVSSPPPDMVALLDFLRKEGASQTEEAGFAGLTFSIEGY